MILNNNKYKKFLTVLSTVGIFLNLSYANSFTYNSASTHITTYQKTSSNYKEVSASNKNVKEETLDVDKNALQVAKEFAPAKIEEVVSEDIHDEMGELSIVKVYLDYTVELEDDAYLIATKNANKAINSEKILIKYL